MAAGMGSRYGGLKQIDPIDPQGHIIMDYSLYDAYRAGFGKVVFVIKKENEEIFREQIGRRVNGRMETEYVFQCLDDIPEGFQIPEGRVKPWGTAHAVLAARNVIDGPFCVINADDFYGSGAFSLIGKFLMDSEDDKDKYHYAMVGYILKNTVTENGHVARGVCSMDENQLLKGIVERTRIIRTESGTAFSEDEGRTWKDLDPESIVSMNMWGFSKSFITELKRRFPAFLEEGIAGNPLKCEYFLPFVVDELLKENSADVRVLRTPDRWYGMTYREDKQTVSDAVAQMKKQGLYPDNF